MSQEEFIQAFRRDWPTVTIMANVHSSAGARQYANTTPSTLKLALHHLNLVANVADYSISSQPALLHSNSPGITGTCQLFLRAVT